LLEGLDEFGLGHIDPSVVYRVLREMELWGWVTSTWDEEQSQGPPRRVYRLSPLGSDVLGQWVTELEESKGRIERFLSTYRRPMEETGREHD
jgi:DNA-binding PadR family transcriptional regulator